jgi:hypothetical protein
MHEDQTPNRLDNEPQNLTILRRMALNLANLEGSNDSMKGELKFVCPDPPPCTQPPHWL